MINIDEQKVDRIRDSLLKFGYSRSECNSLAVDIYLGLAKYDDVILKQEAIRDSVIKNITTVRAPMNTVKTSTVKRKTQTAWRSI
jgi:hypothetical protein